MTDIDVNTKKYKDTTYTCVDQHAYVHTIPERITKGQFVQNYRDDCNFPIVNFPLLIIKSQSRRI
jgi:hypothetical protein